MARALIVGCGCRGRELAAGLLADGWEVRGTSRDPLRLAAIEAVGAEAAVADPDHAATILDAIGDVTVAFWLLGSAVGEAAALAAIHGPRLERVLERLVDSPVRGFVYEAAGRVPRRQLEAGAEIARAAAERWLIPVEIVDVEPDDWPASVEAMAAAAGRLVAART